MNERSFAHHARRRSDATGESHGELVQLLIREFEFFSRGRSPSAVFGSKPRNFSTMPRDRVFSSRLDNLAAFELVWIDVADKLAQRVEMLAPRDGLIVLFDKWYGHKAPIIYRKNRIYADLLQNPVNPV